MANYNNARFISGAVESLANQTYTNFELILVDDASTDKSISIINEIKPQYSFIKCIFLAKNKGYGNALKVAADNANGEIIGILDPDDIIAPETLEIMHHAYINKPESVIIYSTMYNCDEHLQIKEINPYIGSIPEGETYQSLLENKNSHIAHFRTMPQWAYNKTQGFNPKFKKAIDKDIIYKIEELGKTVYINKPLYYYRQHEGSISLFLNKWEAAFWDVKAKHEAYKRRKNSNIPTLSIEQINELYYYTFKKLAIERLNQRNFKKFIKIIIHFLCVSKNPFRTIRFVYYVILKTIKPQEFKNEN